MLVIPSREDLPRGDGRPALDMRSRAGDILRSRLSLLALGDILRSRPSLLALGDLLALSEDRLCEIPGGSNGLRGGWSFL